MPRIRFTIYGWIEGKKKGKIFFMPSTSITSRRLYISHMMCHVHHVHNAVDGFQLNSPYSIFLLQKFEADLIMRSSAV